MQVKVLSTSDVHGYFNADDFRRPLNNTEMGLARAVSVMQIETDKLTDEDLVLKIENGDFIQGSPLTNYIEKIDQKDLPLYDDLAALAGYDVRIIGNHEFNYGRIYLEKALQSQNVLNANILDQKSQTPFLGRPYRIFQKNDLKVGVIGLTTKFIPKWEPEKNIKGLYFADPVMIAKKYIKILRPQVDLLILAYHGGFECDLKTGQPLGRINGENQGYELSQLEGVDALITGHQHRLLAEKFNGLVMTQPGYRGEAVGVMDFTFDEKQKLINSEVKLISTKTTPENFEIITRLSPLKVKVDQWMDQLIGQVGHQMEIIDHQLARIQSHPFVELINRAQMDAGQTQIASTTIFNDEVRGLKNNVTRRDIMTNYVYPNTVVVESLTGQEIIDAIEVSARYFKLTANDNLSINPHFLFPKVQHYNYDLWTGIDYTIDMQKPMNQRVKTVMFQGKQLKLNQSYEVAVNSYRSNGTGNFKMYQASKIVREVQIETADLIADYIQKHQPLNFDQPHNLKIIGYQQIS
ncbi:2',3'-cyclic-nucleotide 2'-phosphodiesterase [Weissella koreensis KACC 15510]|uniref:bifunctional metallophosphatase/5'-nucleotidase n=1 Tax=Weissella koreensis TaxID=165096 RepID=UPI0002174E8E|nr:bifunctional UDP-sugar hydrolase/5'-nucleotidase [Weissella koreensis]AEJ23327.1 2',3'-cyclic-nucleotide 2'-phosphodiesterase [Weissella koreensis KACC 15510]